MMNNGNLGERITIRLTPELREFILLASQTYGVRPAEFCRQTLYVARSGFMRAVEASDGALKKAVAEAEEIARKGMGVDGTDRTSDEHDLV